MNKNFVLIGAAGYVAPKHVKAIKDLNHNLIAAFDPHDAVGYLDSQFPDCAFFTEFERLDRHINKLLDKGVKIDYTSICSPNYLHDSHCRSGLKWGTDVICEKPLVLYSKNIDNLLKIEKQTNHKIFNVLQLRLNPQLQLLKEQIQSEHINKKRDVSLTYHTYRGAWYRYASWKSVTEKSGGLITNIGIHLLDLILWIFGNKVHGVHVYESSKTKVVGEIVIHNNFVFFDLSISEKETKRELIIDGKEIDISVGFADAHTKVYNEIIDGNGFRIDDARPAIVLAERIRELCK